METFQRRVYKRFLTARFLKRGCELVTNGDFSNGLNNWSVVGGSYASVNNGILNSNNTVNGSWFGQYIAQDVSFVNGKTYKITFKAKNISGNLNLRLTQGANVIVNYNLTSEFVSYTYYYTSNADNGSLRMFCNDAVGQFEIDNVSVREVGQDWTLGSGWSIAEDKATVDNTVNANLDQTCLTSGKIYKVSFEISDLLSGGILVGDIVNPGAYDATSNGSHTFYYTATNSTLRVRAYGNPCSITNISVKEVGQNWDILDSVTSFSFNNGIANIQGTANYANNGIKQASISAVIGKTYKISATLRSNDGGLYRFRILDGSYFDLGSGNSAEFETITSYHTATSTAFTIFATSWFTNGTANFDITNISVIEITTDTSLPRINYEGFSYQDALGSEEIVNGGFDTNLNNWVAYSNTLISWESGGYALLDSNNNYWCKIKQSNVFEIGKTYKVILTAKSDRTDLSFHNSPITGSFSEADTFETFEQYYTATTTEFLFGYANAGSATITIDNVSVKEYLGQEVVPDSGCGSWLWEPQSTNTVNNSNPTNALEYSSNITKTNNTAISPDSTFNAMSFTPTATQGIHRAGYSLTAGLYSQNDIVTFSCFVKANGYNFVTVGGFFGQEKAVFNISNGTLVSQESNVINTKIVKLTNDWYRLSTTYTFQNSINNGYLYAGIYVMDTETGYAFTGDGVSGVYGYGFQAELGTGTSYIPTEGSTVTRNQDVCNNGGSLASINSTEGVIYWEGAKLQEASGTQVLGLSDGSGANRIGFQTSATANQIRFVVDAGGNQASKFFVLDDITDFNKLALKWKQDDFSFWVNGIKIGTDTSGNVPALNALNTLDFYYGTGNGTGIYNFTAKTKALAVWKEALSDEELTELTTI